MNVNRAGLLIKNHETFQNFRKSMISGTYDFSQKYSCEKMSLSPQCLQGFGKNLIIEY